MTRQDWRAQGDEFDELCIGGWFHLERMNTNDWDLWLGDRHFNVHVRGEKVTLTDYGEGGP